MADGEFRHAGGQAESSGSGTIARRAALGETALPERHGHANATNCSQNVVLLIVPISCL